MSAWGPARRAARPTTRPTPTIEVFRYRPGIATNRCVVIPGNCFFTAPVQNALVVWGPWTTGGRD